MDTLAGNNVQPNRKQMWMQAILDSAAQLSLLAKAVRTPANTARGVADLFLELDLRGEDLSKTDGEQVQQFRHAVANLLTQAANFLDVSNIESGHFELEKIDFDLKDLVEQTLASIRTRAQAKKLTLKSTFLRGIPEVLAGDPIRLQQIFANLLDNVINLTETGEITFTARADASNPCHLHFRVTGSGTGIPDDLSMGLCRMLSRQMGGSLHPPGESGEGQCDASDSGPAEPLPGSSFTFEVILAPGAPEQEKGRAAADLTTSSNGYAIERAIPASQAPPTQLPQTQRVRILIAEDSEDSRFLLQEFLRGEKYEITFAENGKQALEAALSQPFDLILMDIQMPVMDGLTATRLIREAERQEGRHPTVLLALTAHTRKADIDLSLAAGCTAHVSKPISRLELLSTIQKYPPLQAGQEKEAVANVNIPPGLEEAAERYILSKKKDLPRFLSLIEAEEFDQLRGLAHDMKGTGTSYGFPDLTRLGRLMESSAKEQNAADLSNQLLELSRYVAAASAVVANQAVPVAGIEKR